jgi:hypothetical protein
MQVSVKKIAASLAFITTFFQVVGIATASNIKIVSFSKTSKTPVTIEVADGKAHLIDFSSSNASITGIFVADANEFSKSFKVEPVPNNPQMITFIGVKGGSSKFTANIIQINDEGEQHIQEISLVKRFTSNTVTRIVDNESIAEVAALERGYQVISQNPDVDPELKARSRELVEAARNGEDLDQAANDIGLSKLITQHLIAMGSTN